MGWLRRKNRRKAPPPEPLRVVFTPKEVSEDALIDLYVGLDQIYKQEGGEGLELKWDEGYGGDQYMSYLIMPKDGLGEAYERFSVKASIEVKKFGLKMK